MSCDRIKKRKEKKKPISRKVEEIKKGFETVEECFRAIWKDCVTGDEEDV